METTLHRQLKALYCDAADRQEVTIDGFRIDAVAGDLLIEIQQGSLAALRDKTRRLLERRRVLVVKPLAARKYLVRRARPRGPIESSRFSPSRETLLDLFLDLVHFVEVFPHPRLALEVLLTEQEEHRLPARGRRRRGRGYRVQDRKLLRVVERRRFATAADLAELLPAGLGNPFSTADIARAGEMPRWLAQKMAYCLRKTGGVELVGKQGNSLLYSRPSRRRAAA